jgi:long-chain acyl-CoA synthetase
LLDLGIRAGDRVAILSENRPEWAISDYACLAARCADVPVYPTLPAKQIEYILRDSGAVAIFVSTRAQLEKIREILPGLPELRHVIAFDHELEDDLVISFEALLEQGRTARPNWPHWRDEALAVRPDDLATLIYTSGTTGEPKAVMLSHGNLFETVKLSVETFDLKATDCALSYLPLAHVAEQMTTVHTPAYTGGAVYYAEAPEKIADNLREVRPTIFFGVPRVWERLYDGIQAKLRAASPRKRRLAAWAFGVGRRYVACELEGRRRGPGLAAQWAVAQRLVAARVRRAIGFDRLRSASSGAAPIAREVLELFTGLGIPIYEVYGLSETTGPMTWNQPGRTRLGTVGPPLPSVEVRLADDGEVLARGPNVFMGYLDDPQATAEALEDGWLATGDLGVLDEDGYLTITGRKKNILITSGGKNVAPEGIEKALKQIELLSEAVVIGDGRRFVAALLTLNEDAAAAFARAHGIAADAELHRDPQVLAAIERGVEEVNRRYSRVESVRKFRVLPRQLALDQDELTPTLKVKRRVVQERWAELIEEMYAE